MVRAIAAAALVVWVLSLPVPRLQPWRSSAGYVALSMIVATTLVGALEAVTNVDCPWDLVDFGGIFAFGQEARGAHFLSNDFTGAGIVWVVVTLLYVWLVPVVPR